MTSLATEIETRSPPEPARISEGVIFTTPAPLPRGRHELSRQEVVAVHRERMMIAATELLAHHGPERVGVRDICTRAAVSRAAYYECFTSKTECIFAAYDRFISVIESHLRAVQDGNDGPFFIGALISEYFAMLQKDPVSARAFQLEMDGFGKQARERRRMSLRGIATLVKSQYEKSSGLPPEPLSQYLGAVYAVRQAATDALDEDSTPSLEDLRDAIIPWVERIVATSTQN